VAGFVRIANSADCPPGTSRAFEVGGTRIALFNVAGEFYAVDDRCPHRNESIAEGEVDGLTVVCPVHGSVFDLRSGEVLEPPARESIATYRVRVSKGTIEVEVG